MVRILSIFLMCYEKSSMYFSVVTYWHLLVIVWCSYALILAKNKQYVTYLESTIFCPINSVLILSCNTILYEGKYIVWTYEWFTFEFKANITRWYFLEYLNQWIPKFSKQKQSNNTFKYVLYTITKNNHYIN